MDSTQMLIVALVGLAALCVGAAATYVLLKATLPKQSWMQLVVIVQTAQVVWQKVFTPEAAAFAAKKLYDGLQIEQRFGYTLDEFTAMLMWLVPVEKSETRDVGASVPKLAYGFDELALKNEVEAIMVGALRDYEADDA